VITHSNDGGINTSTVVGTRVVLAERLVRRDHLHGAWWPQTTDLQRELTPMLSRVLTRVHSVIGVTLSRVDWPEAPLFFQAKSGRDTKISWYGLGEPNLAVVHASEKTRIVLLLIPPETPEDVALTAMLMSTSPGNCFGTVQALAKARERAQIDHGKPDRPCWSGRIIP